MRYLPFIKGGHLYKQFLQNYPTKSFKKGHTLFTESDKPTVAFVVKKGIVRAYILTSEGELRLVKLHLPGDILPIAWVFGRTQHAQYYFDAFVDCELHVVPRAQLVDAIFANPLILEHIFNRVLDKHIAAILRVGALEYSKASEKVLHMMQYFCIYYGRELKKDHVEIQLSLTQQDLASTMGLTRETTGIELKKLERKGVLSRRGGRYVVKTDKLNELLDEEYMLRQSVNEVASSLKRHTF